MTSNASSDNRFLNYKNSITEEYILASNCDIGSLREEENRNSFESNALGCHIFFVWRHETDVSLEYELNKKEKVNMASNVASTSGKCHTSFLNIGLMCILNYDS